jgi:hypothetical protein
MKPWQAYEGYEDNLPNHVLLNRVADAAGVSTRSITRVAKKRLEQEGKRDRKRLKGCPYTFVSVSLWDDYMQIGNVARLPKKPKGWLTSKALCGQGFSRRKLYELVKEGTLEAVYVRNTLYFEPRRAEQCLQERQNLRPPPGWVGISEVTRQAKRTRQAFWTYLKTHGITTKMFLHTSRDQLVHYVTVEVANEYLATVAETGKHVPKMFQREPSPESSGQEVCAPRAQETVVPVIYSPGEARDTESTPEKVDDTASTTNTASTTDTATSSTCDACVLEYQTSDVTTAHHTCETSRDISAHEGRQEDDTTPCDCLCSAECQERPLDQSFLQSFRPGGAYAS